MLLSLILMSGIAAAETSLTPPKVSVVDPGGRDRNMASKTPEEMLEPKTTDGNADGAITSKDTKTPGSRIRVKDTPVVPGDPCPVGTSKAGKTASGQPCVNPTNLNKPKPIPGTATPTGSMQKPGGFMESDSAASSSP